ncbi:hypothetical protein P692DRAFT_201867879, partial [Suillus brevipes Sb2]
LSSCPWVETITRIQDLLFHYPPVFSLRFRFLFFNWSPPQEFIVQFKHAIEELPSGSLLIPITPEKRRHTISEPSPSKFSFLVGDDEREPSPITPSPISSVKDESLDDFASIDAPRSNLPGAYHSTPKQAQKSRAFPSTDALIESREPARVASSSSTPKASLAKLEMHIKQEFPEIQQAPNAIPGGLALSNLPSTYAPVTTSLPQPKPLPTIPAQQTPNMSTSTPFRMPIRGTDRAPKFNGTTLQLRDFLETFDANADDAGLLGNDRIKQILRYLNSDDRELWSGLPEASSSDYHAFIKEVKDMYPGWEGDRRYTVADLRATSSALDTAERDRIFLEGLPSDIQTQTRTRLLIKFPDHHLQDPYPFKDVRAAALVLLPESLPPPQSASIPVNPALTNLLPKTAQKPAKGAVTKREYPRPTTPQFEGCIFCGASDHYIGRCSERAKYLEAGKCKRDDSNKLVLPNGNRIFGPEPTLKEKIDRFLESERNTPTHSVQACLFYRASPEVECVIEVDPSAFVHSVVDSDTDEDEDVRRIENAKHVLALATAKLEQKRNAKGKPRARPAPTSRHATVEEELVSPAIQASSNKGKGLEVAKIPSPAASDAPVTGAKSSSSSSSASKTANTSTPAHAVPAPPPTGTYRLSCALEDKGAEKRITDQILDITIQVPVRDILAVSPDIRKNFRDMSSNKRVTVGTVSVNELSSHPANRDWMRQYDGSHMRSDDGRIVANHYAALRCIRASTVGGRILTCVLDQGTEVVVMPKDVWQSLGVGLHSDHRLNMESVNTTRDSTLGVIENIPLDFGGGPMFFQAQVTERANFEILLGRPFFTLTSCRTFDLPDGEQDIVITDPNTGKEMRIPTLPWVKNCQSATHGAPCIEGTHSHARANVSQVNGQGF